MNIVGGCYIEECLSPLSRHLFGSGLRAVMAVSEIYDEEINFYTAATISEKNFIESIFERLNAQLHLLHERHKAIAFSYDYSIASPSISAHEIKEKIDFSCLQNLSGPVLVFGLIEFEKIPCIKAEKVVYDPQSSDKSLLWSENSGEASELAVVLNSKEADSIANRLKLKYDSLEDLACKLRVRDSADVFIIKDGVWGGAYSDEDGGHKFSVYKTGNVFGIGSGDIFSSIFSALWFKGELSVKQCIESASVSTAFYCNNKGALPIPKGLELLFENYKKIEFSRKINKKVYLAAPFFSLANLWLVNQAYNKLKELGLDVWSPSVESGILGKNASEEAVVDVVQSDLSGIDSCDAMFLILDGNDTGTIFEGGYAVKLGKPVTVYAPNSSQCDLTMFQGSGCIIKNDFSSALYHVAWSLSS